MSESRLRVVSAKVFGNAKVIEVVLALVDESSVATAKAIAARTGIDHSLVRDVLVRFVAADILQTLPRTAARAPLFYAADPDDAAWQLLVQLARHLHIKVSHQSDSSSEARTEDQRQEVPSAPGASGDTSAMPG